MSAVIRLPSETTIDAFERAISKLPPSQRPRLKCDCGGMMPWDAPGAVNHNSIAQHVFKCRAVLVKNEPHFACGQWCCACVGGSDDNRCSECWCERDAWLEQQKVRDSFIALAAQRVGITLDLRHLTRMRG